MGKKSTCRESDSDLETDLETANGFANLHLRRYNHLPIDSKERAEARWEYLKWHDEVKRLEKIKKERNL